MWENNKKITIIIKKVTKKQLFFNLYYNIMKNIFFTEE